MTIGGPFVGTSQQARHQSGSIWNDATVAVEKMFYDENADQRAYQYMNNQQRPSGQGTNSYPNGAHQGPPPSANYTTPANYNTYPSNGYPGANTTTTESAYYNNGSSYNYAGSSFPGGAAPEAPPPGSPQRSYHGGTNFNSGTPSNFPPRVDHDHSNSPPLGAGYGGHNNGEPGGNRPPIDALQWLAERHNELWEQNLLDAPPRDYVPKTPLNAVPTWASTGNAAEKFQNFQSGGSSSSTAAPGSPFGVDQPLNTRVRLFCGDVASLEVDAVAFDFSYSSLTKSTGHRLLSLGGAKLITELCNAERMRSGEAQVMKGNFGNLHCSKVLPFCGPNYKEKYTTAAKNTLSQCVRNVTGLCYEVPNSIKSLAFPLQYAAEKQFPLDQCLHVVFRTLRRWLPKLQQAAVGAAGGSSNNNPTFVPPQPLTVVLYTEHQAEYELAQTLLQLYFPRSPEDSVAGMALVGPDFSFGTATGEEEQSADRVLKVPDFVARRRQEEEEESDDNATTAVRKKGLPDPAGHEPDDLHGFSTEFHADWTEKEVARLDATLWDVESTNDLHHIYLRYLREAASPAYASTMRELDRFEFLVYAGKDQLGRHVIVFSEALIPIARYEQDILIRYIVSKIEPYSNASFLIVYAHGGMASANAILDVWKELIRISQFKYSRFLQNLLVLHPTLSFKAAFALLSYYIPESLYENSIYFESIAELTRWLNFPGLELAPCIRNYEQERNESLFGNWW
ncbi:unnamed protein product [Amoebophrya sp. A120]|nr:unnamed protein product [Amoebophrya sp. A120]|eukprot:GSA120T00002003001.1